MLEFCNALSEKQNLEKCYSNGHWAYYDEKKNKDVTEEDYNKDQKKEYSKRQVAERTISTAAATTQTKWAGMVATAEAGHTQQRRKNRTATACTT